MWPTLACRIRPPDEGWEHQRHLLQVQMDGNVFGDEIVQTLLQSTGADSWYVDRAFNDVNTTKVAAFLANLARGEHHLPCVNKSYRFCAIKSHSRPTIGKAS